MRRSWQRLRVLGAALGACAVLAASGAAAEDARSGWYVGASVGTSRVSDMEQAGRNRDDICYPDSDCSGGAPEGYRWLYDLDPESAAAFEVAVGRMFGRWRLELSLSERRNKVKQKFSSISYLDGSRSVPNPASNYRSATRADADRLSTRTLALGVYHDFALPGSRFTPYLGAGLGVSFVELSGVYFEARYSCANSAPDCANPERYDSRQDVDLADAVLSTHLHAGLDYALSDRFLLGLKLSYSMVEDAEDAGGYAEHPVPGIKSVTEISGMNHWALTLGVKYLFGE